MPVSAAVTANVPLLVAVPPGVVTLIGPLVAPEGTVALIELSAATVNEALEPLNVTDVTPAKPEPEIATLVPGGPLLGANDEIVGVFGVVVVVTVTSVVVTFPSAVPDATLTPAPRPARARRPVAIAAYALFRVRTARTSTR